MEKGRENNIRLKTTLGLATIAIGFIGFFGGLDKNALAQTIQPEQRLINCQVMPPMLPSDQRGIQQHTILLRDNVENEGAEFEVGLLPVDTKGLQNYLPITVYPQYTELDDYFGIFGVDTDPTSVRIQEIPQNTKNPLNRYACTAQRTLIP